MQKLLRILALAASCVLASAHVRAARERPLYDNVFFEPCEDVVTPHIAWAKPYSGAPPKVLFITHRNAMREIVEIAQRLSLDYAVFAAEKPDQFGETGIGVDCSWRLIQGNSAEELAESLRGKLAADYDVIVVGNFKWDELPLDCRYLILKKVKEGAGLVGAIPKGRGEYLGHLLKSSEFGWGAHVWAGGANGIPDYFGVGVFECSVDYGAGHTGTASVRIVGKEVGRGSRESPRAGYNPGVVKLEPSTEYVFSMWTKTEGLKPGGALVSLYPQGKSLAAPATPDWTRSEVRFKTDDKRLTTGVYLLNYQVGTVWYDDVCLTKAGQDENLLPNPSFENPGPAPRALAAGVPFKSLPAFSASRDEQAFLRNTVMATRFGQGRIGLVRYAPPRCQMMTPGPRGPVQDCRLDYDYYLAAAIKLILWGAGREPEVTVSSGAGPLLTPDRGELAGSPARFRLEAAHRIEKATLELKVRDRWNRPHHGASRSIALEPGGNEAAFELPALPRGAYFADLWVRVGKATAGFGSVALAVTSEAHISEVTLGKDSFSRGEPVTGKIAVAAARPDSRLRLRVADLYGRQAAELTTPVTGPEVEFTLSAPGLLTIVGRIEAELLCDGVVADVCRRDFSLNDLAPDLEDAQLVMWVTYQNDFIGPLMAEQFTRSGTDAQYGGRGGAGYAPYARQRWLPYATRFTDTKTDWYQLKKTREAGDLVRTPCLTDPDYRNEVREGLLKRTSPYFL